MFKKIATFIIGMYVAISFAAVDVNKASAADLDSIKGIGPTTSGSILAERKKGDFKDWDDLINRVKGIGEVKAGKFSESGLTVNGTVFKGLTPAATKAEEKKIAPASKAASAAKK